MSSANANTCQTEFKKAVLPKSSTIWLASIATAIIFLLFSPNFQASISNRVAPLGSDFLQEWTGGFIWSSSHRSQLYEPSHFKTIQHTPDIVGFSWPSDSYYPMVYPPFYYMLLSPFACLPYSVALMIWVIGLGIATAATILLWTTYYPPARDHWRMCLILALAFFPFLMSFNTAHKSIFLLLILTGTFLLLYHNRSRSAGLVFGLMAFKPHLGLLIGLCMLLKRQYEFVAGSVLTVTVLVLLSLLAGPDLCYDYFRQMTSLGNYAVNGGYKLSSSHNLWGALALTFGPDSTLARCLFIGILAALIWMLSRSLEGGIETSSRRFALQFSVMIMATILTSPHLYVYDLTIFLLPLGLVMFNLNPGGKTGNSNSKKLVYAFAFFYVVSGLSVPIANVTGVQPTIFLLLWIIYLLSDSHGHTQHATNFPRTRDAFAH